MACLLKRTTKREQSLEMALGVLGAAGVIRLRLNREAGVFLVSDLLAFALAELEQVAEAEGGVRWLPAEEWTKVHKVHSLRGL
jgi:hypothetical protein